MAPVTKDPGREALNMLLQRSWQEGFAAGLKRRAAGSFCTGLLIGAIVTLSLVGTWAFAQTIPPGANKYKHELTKTARSIWGMEAPISSLAAQLHQESHWNSDARSYVGAAGLAQFMRSTARDMAERYPELAPVNIFDPAWAIRAQSRYMFDLYQSIKGSRNSCERAAFAMAAYNGGLGWVNKRRALAEDPSRCFGAACDVNPGITPSNQKENREYPRRILLSLTPLYYEAQWGPAWCLSYVKGP